MTDYTQYFEDDYELDFEEAQFGSKHFDMPRSEMLLMMLLKEIKDLRILVYNNLEGLDNE